MIRSLLAVVLGYVVMLVAFLGAETALTAVAPELIPQKGKPTDPLYFVFQLVTGFFFICIGGYITALLAGRSEVKHALGLGALSIAMSIVSRLEYPGDEPLWYSIALMFLAIPAALVGGHFRARQVEEERTHAAAGD
jgi:peptidoglycan/LPS O-acetylase OafA/YrhL